MTGPIHRDYSRQNRQRLVQRMTESNIDRFIDEAEACLQQAEIATDPFDKIAWVQLAEDWIKLARAVKEREA
jgi:hypothetical protein